MLSQLKMKHVMEPFVHRRQCIQGQLGKDEAFLIRQPKAVVRNNDVSYPFHPNRSFYYLTGFNEPNAWLLITQDTSLIWSETSDKTTTLWEGEKMGSKVCSILNIDQHHPIDQLDATLSKHLKSIKSLYCIGTEELDLAKYKLLDGQAVINTQRFIKDNHEQLMIQKACEISAQAHNHLMTSARPGMNERALEGMFFNHTCTQGSRSLAYPSIVAAGENACTLHYTRNNTNISDGQLVLVDAGCEHSQYASDITRTFPINGSFTQDQLAVYTSVLHVQEQVVALLKPGIPWQDIQQAAARLMCEQLITLGLIPGPVSTALANNTHLKYFPHGIGHSMGLDVHDIPIKPDDVLSPGMVFTIEPGIYINHTHKRFKNIGIRIEDNFLITDQGYKNLTKTAVKTPEDIAALMQS